MAETSAPVQPEEITAIEDFGQMAVEGAEAAEGSAAESISEKVTFQISDNTEEYVSFLGGNSNPVVYEVSFNTDGGSEVLSQMINAGECATRPAADPTKDEFVFKGWFTDNGFETEFDFANTPINGNTTIYAKWNKLCTITFYNCGVASKTPDPVKVEYGTTYKTPGNPGVPNKSNYEDKFGGWFYDAEFENAYDESIPITKDITLYAKWPEKKGKETQYLVTFEANGGEPVPKAIKVKKGNKVSRPSPDPEKEGFIFGGWFKDSGCTDDWDFSNDTVSAKITLYAKWTVPEYTITVKIVNEEYGTADPLSVKVKRGTTCNIVNHELVFSDGQTIRPVPYEGYTLEHIRNVDNYDCIDSDSEAEIGFREKEFKVTFDSMGGSSVKNQMVFFNHVATEPSPAPTKEGYTFDGWYKDDALTTRWNFTADLVKGATTLYAKWNKNSDPKPIPTPSHDDNDQVPLFTGTWGNPVKNGAWSQDALGIWHYSTSQFFSNTWAYILNPYAQQGQNTSDWFWFDKRGNMLTGWQFINGKWYYLNPRKDGTLGACQIGGVTPDGWTVDKSGAWIESIPKK